MRKIVIVTEEEDYSSHTVRREAMKDYYKINEISKLYGIGVDSLRYYEKLEILKPRRDTNGYRLYDLKDMYKLTVIRDLRKLDFSMAQIKEFLGGQCVDNTLSLLREERELLDAQMEEIARRKALIGKRIASLSSARMTEDGIPVLKKMARRRCVRIEQYITRDEEMDFVIRKLQKKYEDRIQDLGTQTIGAFFAMDDMERGIANSYKSVFFVMEDPGDEADFVLPEGIYASLCYRGGYNQNGERVRDLQEYVRREGLAAAGTPFEIYRIDNRDTIREEEFLTEIQILLQ